jgi:hypothetical protein
VTGCEGPEGLLPAIPSLRWPAVVRAGSRRRQHRRSILAAPHKGTSLTMEPHWQGHLTDKGISLTREPHWQGNLTDKGTSLTMEYHWQGNLTVRGTTPSTPSREPHWQGNISDCLDGQSDWQMFNEGLCSYHIISCLNGGNSQDQNQNIVLSYNICSSL